MKIKVLNSMSSNYGEDTHIQEDIDYLYGKINNFSVFYSKLFIFDIIAKLNKDMDNWSDSVKPNEGKGITVHNTFIPPFLIISNYNDNIERKYLEIMSDLVSEKITVTDQDKGYIYMICRNMVILEMAFRENINQFRILRSVHKYSLNTPLRESELFNTLWSIYKMNSNEYCYKSKSIEEITKDVFEHQKKIKIKYYNDFISSAEGKIILFEEESIKNIVDKLICINFFNITVTKKFDDECEYECVISENVYNFLVSIMENDNAMKILHVVQQSGKIGKVFSFDKLKEMYEKILKTSTEDKYFTLLLLEKTFGVGTIFRINEILNLLEGTSEKKLCVLLKEDGLLNQIVDSVINIDNLYIRFVFLDKFLPFILGAYSDEIIHSAKADKYVTNIESNSKKIMEFINKIISLISEELEINKKYNQVNKEPGSFNSKYIKDYYFTGAYEINLFDGLSKNTICDIDTVVGMSYKEFKSQYFDFREDTYDANGILFQRIAYLIIKNQIICTDS